MKRKRYFHIPHKSSVKRKIKRSSSASLYYRRKKIGILQTSTINILACLVVLFLIITTIWIIIKPTYKKVVINSSDVQAFRIPAEAIKSIYSLSNKYNTSFPELLTVFSLDNNFFPQKSVVLTNIENIEAKYILNYSDIKRNFSDIKYAEYFKIISTITNEVKVFPIPIEYTENDFMFGDSYGAQRNYSDTSFHNGTDILDRENIRGRMAILSMTDGIVYDFGWGEKSGYYVGIKTINNTYYFYAHMDYIEPNIQKGDILTAGQKIGQMGDTGYSKTPGTTGNFPVHLHVEIMPETTLSKNFNINPYPILMYISEKTKIIE